MQSFIDDGKGNAVTIPIGIGEGSHIRKAIVDKNSRIGKNVMVLNLIYIHTFLVQSTTCASTSKSMYQFTLKLSHN